ncbi:MAG: beta-ketoacyl synthase N-terminal-like domain-containing protein [Polyangiales bacterium]
MPRALPPVTLRRFGAVTAAGLGLDSFWRAVAAAEPLARPVARYDVTGLAVRRAALVPADVWRDVEARRPGVPRAAALALAAVDDALGGEAPDPDTALFLGTSLGGVDAWEPWHAALVRGEAMRDAPACAGHDDVAPLVARALGLRGPAVTVSTACTSSAAALMMAADAVRLGECERALVVGVDVLGRFVHAGFDRLGALTPDALAPRPFCADRAGMWLGEAAAAVLVTRDGPGVARYLGGGAAGDGVHMTAPDREGGGLARAVERSLAEAGLGPDAVCWVSAHATSTRFNDAMEAAGLARVFGSRVPPTHGAKPVVGHTLGASGLLEAALCAEALVRGVRPPTHAPGATDPALAHVPVDRAAAPMGAGVALSLNSAMAGHNTAVVLGAP